MSNFVVGYASDVWVQQEPSILAASTSPILVNNTIAMFSMEQAGKTLVTRQAANSRQDFYKTVQASTNLKLKFELRFTTAILTLIQSLLSLTAQSGDEDQSSTWEAEFTDPVSTLKIWLRDARTQECYLYEGCAVSDMEITAQDQTITYISFGIIALKTTYNGSFSDPLLTTDDNLYPIVPAQFCSVYFSEAYFTNDPFDPFNGGDPSPFFIPGATKSSLLVTRNLEPAQFRNGLATRFKKTPAKFVGTIDCQVTSYLRSLLQYNETYGSLFFRFGQDANYALLGLMQKVALSFNETQLQSPADTPTTTITATSVEDMVNYRDSILAMKRENNYMFSYDLNIRAPRYSFFTTSPAYPYNETANDSNGVLNLSANYYKPGGDLATGEYLPFETGTLTALRNLSVKLTCSVGGSITGRSDVFVGFTYAYAEVVIRQNGTLILDISTSTTAHSTNAPVGKTMIITISMNKGDTLDFEGSNFNGDYSNNGGGDYEPGHFFGTGTLSAAIGIIAVLA